jgi:hypothetical protein
MSFTIPRNLTLSENNERLRLLELQADRTRFFSQEEFDRLKFLSNMKFISNPDPSRKSKSKTIFDSEKRFYSFIPTEDEGFFEIHIRKEQVRVGLLDAETGTIRFSEPEGILIIHKFAGLQDLINSAAELSKSYQS